MPSARVHSIAESDRFVDYAEMPCLQRIEESDWLYERLKKDREAEALFWIAIFLGIVFCICAWGPK